MRTNKKERMIGMTKRLNLLLEFVMLTLGAVIAAFAIEEFLVPNTILDGGVIGIGIMINNLTGVSLSILTIVLNIPFLIIGSRQLGKLFIVKAGYSMAVFSVFVEIFKPLENATSETILAVCFGGVILGLGVGIIIKFGGCLDGTETVAIMLNKKKDWPVGRLVLGMNLVIYAIAGLLFGFDRAMYSLLTYFITSKVLDMVESGLEQAKAAMIITDDAREVADKIYKQLGRTVTIMQGKGMNLVIYAIAGLLFGFDRAMYSLLTYFITSKVLDMVESGLEQAKAAMIITDDAREVADKIYKQLGRTVTIMQGKGMISGNKTVLYCVLTRFEIGELKRIIKSIDSSAFVTVTDVAEIIGNHIKDNEYKEMLEKVEKKESNEQMDNLPEHESMEDFESLKKYI